MSYLREFFSKQTWRVMGDTIFGFARWGVRGEWDFWEEQEEERLKKVAKTKPEKPE